ncbi:hypothetical protein V500_02344 [Pseudogymnoascus sp. VKM F-4518 (FW-2643)]|nr:hypothetical protein V500_02344 [Pseudogymnoascus sp. VKM F-4518 (FW-2643)]
MRPSVRPSNVQHHNPNQHDDTPTIPQTGPEIHPQDEAKISRTTSSSAPCPFPADDPPHPPHPPRPKPSLLLHVTEPPRPLVPRPPIGRPHPWCDIGHPAAATATTSLPYYTAQHITLPGHDA